MQLFELLWAKFFLFSLRKPSSERADSGDHISD